MLLQLALESFEKRQSVGRRARKSCQHLIIEKAPDFPSRMLHHLLSHGYLAIAGHHHFVIAADAQDRGAVYPPPRSLSWHPGIIPLPGTPPRPPVFSSCSCLALDRSAVPANLA